MVETRWYGEDRHAYRITRYRKHSKHKNSIVIEHMSDTAITWTDITKAGATTIQQQINDIMGADETVFRASCFYQQEEPLDIPAMSDKELKALLERFLPVEDLERGYKRASEEVAEYKAKLANFQRTVERSEAEVEAESKHAIEVLEEKSAYTKKANEKNSQIDSQIRGKKVAKAVALTASNIGDIPEQLKKIDEELAALGPSDKRYVEHCLGDAKSQVEHYVNLLKDPKGKDCYACGQQIDDVATTTKRYTELLAKAEGYVKEELANLAIASENHAKKEELRLKKRHLEHKYNECVAAKRAADNLTTEIKLLEGQKLDPLDNPYSGQINRLRDALRASKGRLSDLKEALKLAQGRLQILEAAQLALSPKGARYHLLEKVAPKLTEATNQYLDILTDGKIKAIWSTVTKTGKGDYVEKFSIKAHLEGREKFGLLSGGEKRKVRLACFLALQNLIASRATKNIDIWIGDEIDHALDGAGLERLMVLLNEIAKKKSTILVISHNELREWIPNYAVVVRKDGVSTVNGYLNA
jgi:DNA repair exonuclease SbcCD ATPase subunit